MATFDDKPENEINDVNPPTEAATENKPTFAQTPTAAKLSGAYLQAAGKLKQKWGEYTDDPELMKQGRQQEVLGKIHRLVGNVRELRQSVVTKVQTTQKEGREVCVKHGVRLIDVASDFVADMKKVLFK